MEPATLSPLVLLTATLCVTDVGDSTLEVALTPAELRQAGGSDDIYEALSGRDDLAGPYSRYRIRLLGDLPALAPGEPDPVVTLLAGTGAPVLAPADGEGALSGLTIVLSPGHGVYFSESRGVWTTQRGEHNGILEDWWTARFVSLWLAPMLEAAGARVLDTRRHLSDPWEEVVGSDHPGVDLTQGSWWSTDEGGEAHLCCNPAGEGCTARFSLVVPEAGVHPVMIRHPPGDGTSPGVTWTVALPTWDREVHLDPDSTAGLWTSLGRVRMQRGDVLYVTVHAGAGEPGTLQVLGVRVGGGVGDVTREGTVSGAPRWQEGARYWLQTACAPRWVTHASDTDLYSDRRARGRMAAWLGADLFLAVHTNGGGGTGTVTFVHESRPPPGSPELAHLVQGAVVEAIRAGWDDAWTDRGVKEANMDELADARPMPSALLEVGFHDSETDAALLRQPLFRRDVSRAIVRGVIASVSPFARPVPPAPRWLSVRNLGGGRLRVSWEPGFDPLAPVREDWTYRLHVGTESTAVDGGLELAGCCEATVDGFSPGDVVVLRLSARNESGSSLLSSAASVVVGDPPALALLVDGFERMDEQVDETVNAGDSSFAHARALRLATGELRAADFATHHEAPAILSRQDYTLVDWWTGLSGPGSPCVDEGQARAMMDHLARGGALFISGEDLASCMVHGGPLALQLVTRWLGARPMTDARCEDHIELACCDVLLTLGPEASGPYATQGASALAALEDGHPFALCASGAAAAVLMDPDPYRGGSVLMNVGLESAGDLQGRGDLLRVVLPSLGVQPQAPEADFFPDATTADAPDDEPRTVPARGGCSAGAIR